MAIKRSKSKKSDALQLPDKLDDLLRDGFTCSVLEKKFKEDGKEIRDDVIVYLETNKDGFEVELSKSFKTEYGSVNFKQRQNFDVDKDALIEMVNNGTVTIETLIHLGSFNGTKLIDAGCGDAVEEADPTEYLELRPAKEFKDKVDTMWGEGEAPVDLEEEIEEPKPKKKVAKKKATPKKSATKARAAAAAAKARAKAGVNADDDLDAILGE